MAISYRCDRCGRESEQPLVVISVGVVDDEDYSDRTAARKEVCKRCADELGAQFDRFAEGS